MRLIDKDVIITEIEKLIERAKAERVLHPKTILAAKNYLLIEDYNKLLSFINDLEVKEVDLERYYNEFFKEWRDYQGIDSSVTDQEGNCVTLDDIKDACRHFFELGVKARQG